MQHSALHQLQTNKGKTIEELSQEHRVVLLFIKFFGCPVCQQNIEALAKWTPSFLKLNTIPVICHPESEENFQHFAEKHKSRFHIHPEMLRVSGVTFEIKKQLGIHTAGLMKHLKSMPLNIKLAAKDKRVLEIPLSIGLKNITSEFALFLVEKGKIVNSYSFKKFSDRPDYAKFILDLDLYFDASVGHYQSKIENMFPTLIAEFKKNENRNSLFEKGEFQLGPSAAVQRESVTLASILENESCRRVFKRFVMKEHSVENVLFVEQVEQYKLLNDDLARENKAKEILSAFFNSDSLFQINVDASFKEEIEQIIQTKQLSRETFDRALIELKGTVLSDSFMRFKTHVSYQEEIVK